MAKLHELQERRAHVVSEMRSINEKAEAEKRDYTADEDTKHKTLKTELAGLDKNIERARDLAEAERAAPAIVHSGRIGDGAYEKRAHEFSIVKAIRARLGEPEDDGFEREISAEVRRRAGRAFNGIAVPDQVFQVERRTLLVGSSAADLVPNPHLAGQFIDRLRAALVTGALGATILDNLAGTPIDIPRQTGSSTAQWVAEDGSLTETDATFDDCNLAPKTVGAMTSYSRRTLLNSSPAIEEIIRRDFTAIIANAIDAAAMTGPGTGNTPTGIITQSGVGSVTFATPSWAGVLEFVADVQTANALTGSPGFAMNAYAVKKLRSTVKVATTDSAMIMELPNTLAGYPVGVTSSLPGDPTPTAGVVIFGNWQELLVAYWTGVDILVNPYETTAYAKGRVMIRVMRDVDVAVRHAASFTKAIDMAV